MSDVILDAAAEQQLIVEARDRLILAFPQEASRITEAVELARLWHGEVRRKSGELFVLHPLATAEIMVEQGADVEVVLAAILHDVIEDTDCQQQEITARFGEEVSHIVDGVTKVTRLAPRGSKRRAKADTYRKLLLAASSDARVLSVKLGDRLHNIRTIASMPPDRQRDIARETMDIYAPLAHRLGMNAIKEELEDRSFQVLDPRAYEDAAMLRMERIAGSGPLLDGLNDQLRRVLADHGIHGEIKARVKSHTSIAGKMARSERGEIFDVLGMRVIVDTVPQCYLVLCYAHSLWKPREDRFHDYVAVPKVNLYQSLHTTVMANGQPVEIQIRTKEMHEIAERGVAAHWHYKQMLRDGSDTKSAREMMAGLAANNEDDALEAAFFEMKNEVLAEEIYVFTPRGDIVLLPEGSCAVDMAYAIHSDLGNHCTGCLVDGAMRPITRPLSNGEVVEIKTGSRNAPSRDWLAHVQTTRARSRIRAYYQHEMQAEQIVEGTRLLMARLHAAGLGPLAHTDKLADALEQIGLTTEAAALDVAHDETRARHIVRRIVHSLAGPEEAGEQQGVTTKRARIAEAGKDVGVLVEGVDTSMVRMAKCCLPEPGDEIIGYVSLARGVAIHQADCPQAAQLEDDRKLPVRWDLRGPETYRTRVAFVMLDRPGLLTEISDAVLSVGGEIHGASTDTTGTVARGEVRVTVTTPDQAQRVREALADLPDVLSVRRAGDQPPAASSDN